MRVRKQIGLTTLLALSLFPLIIGQCGAQQPARPVKLARKAPVKAATKAAKTVKTKTKAAIKSPVKPVFAQSASTNKLSAQLTEADAPVPAAATTAEIGKPFRDFTLRDLASEEGATLTLSTLKGKKTLVAVFMANRCGATWTYDEKIGKLLKDYADKDVQIVAIHSNYEETDAEIREPMEQRNLLMPILDDKKTQAFADYVGAFSTPIFIIVDKEGILRYKGAFDRYGDDKQPYLRPALDAILADEPVKTPITRALGCVIARRTRTAR